MKKAIMLLICIALITFISACESKPTNDNVNTAKNTVITLVDYFHSDELPWGENVDRDIPEFPKVIFRWSSREFVSIKDGVQTILIEGMPIWNVFATDLNGDNMPELCATISVGSGIVDSRVIVLDYANDKSYGISARMHYDYHLSKQDDKLIIARKPYAQQDDSDSNIGNLSIKNQQLIIEYITGEIEKVDATNPSK